jgi:hypothetical protein
MIYIRTIAVVAFALLFGRASLQAQDLSRYRDFRLGSTLASVLKTSGTTAADVKVIHQRPAVIQELRWRPPVKYNTAMDATEPVREAVFRFCDGQLFQIVVDYDRERTEGLTDADLIEAITSRYGLPVLNATSLRTVALASSPVSIMPTSGDTVIARWSSAENSVVLVRAIYPTTLRLVMSLTSLETIAQTASADAIRLDKAEAPQREIDRVQKNAEDGRVAGEKARGVNKPLFKP